MWIIALNNNSVDLKPFVNQTFKSQTGEFFGNFDLNSYIHYNKKNILKENPLNNDYCTIDSNQENVKSVN